MSRHGESQWESVRTTAETELTTTAEIELTTRQPANALVFSLKPPQLSLLQRYLSIQEEDAYH